MKFPRLEVYLNDQAQLAIAHFRVPDRGPLLVEIDLGEAMAGSFEDAAKRLGEVLLRTLMLWHKKEFAQLSDFSVPGKQPLIDDMAIASILIEKSIQSKTSIYVPAIEKVLSSPSSAHEDCQKFYLTAWPEIRTNLKSYS